MAWLRHTGQAPPCKGCRLRGTTVERGAPRGVRFRDFAVAPGRPSEVGLQTCKGVRVASAACIGDCLGEELVGADGLAKRRFDDGKLVQRTRQITLCVGLQA